MQNLSLGAAHSVVPIFIGEYEEQNKLKKFNNFDTSMFPDLMHAGELKVSSAPKTIRETMAALFKIQGVHLDPDSPGEVQRHLFEVVKKHSYAKIRRAGSQRGSQNNGQKREKTGAGAQSVSTEGAAGEDAPFAPLVSTAVA